MCRLLKQEKTDDGYRVKGIVDGETRVGIFSRRAKLFPKVFTLWRTNAEKRVAELEQESKYWKKKPTPLKKKTTNSKSNSAWTPATRPTLLKSLNRMRFSSIDLGTNTCLLLIAEKDETSRRDHACGERSLHDCEARARRGRGSARFIPMRWKERWRPCENIPL